jgi:hypothetical protein
MQIGNERVGKTMQMMRMAAAICMAALAMSAAGQVTDSGTTGTVPVLTETSRLLDLAATTFSNGKVIQQVELTGNATWRAGSLEDSGNVTLTVSKDGSSKMQLDLDTLGSRSESQTGKGFNVACAWAHSDGIAHPVRSGSCMSLVLWFLPAFSLQPSQLGAHKQFIDLGEGPVGSSSTVYRHLQSEYVSQDSIQAVASALIVQNTVDIGLDPNSLGVCRS